MALKKLAVLLGVAVLVAALGLFVVNTAFAQSSTPPAQGTPATPGQKGLGRGFGFGLFGGGRAGQWKLFDAEAQALNLTPTQLFEQLHSGKTLSQVAQAQGVDLQKVQDAVKAARTQAEKDAINQAVANGRITKAQGDWLLQGLDQGFLGRGFGGMRGGRFGGMHGFKGGQGAAPAPAPTNPAPGTTS